MKRKTLSYSKEEVAIECGDSECEKCPHLGPAFRCGLFLGQTNYVSKDTAHRLSICRAGEEWLAN